MKLIFLLSFLVAVAVDSSYSVQLPGLIKSFESLRQGWLMCGGLCLAKHQTNIMEEMQNVCIPAVTSITEKFEGLTENKDIYNILFTRKNDVTQICRWAKDIVKKCTPSTLKQCKSGIQDAYYNFASDILAYVCTNDPPFIECIMSPEFAKDSDIAKCGMTFVTTYAHYFFAQVQTPTEYFQLMKTFYAGVVTKDNGAKLYRDITGLGTCIADILGMNGRTHSGGSCASVASDVNREVTFLVDYVKASDLLTCGLKPELHEDIYQCGLSMMQDVHKNPAFSALDPQTKQPIFLEQIKKMQFGIFKPIWTKLRTCSMNAVRTRCQQNWVYKTLEIQTKVIDTLINNAAPPGFCSRVTGKSGGTGRFGYASVASVASVAQTSVVKVLLSMLGAAVFL